MQPNRTYPPLTVLGLMSGTSLDGADACLARLELGQSLQCQLLASLTHPFPAALKAKVLRNLEPASSRVDALCELNMELGRFFAGAALALLSQSGAEAREVDLIGSHGQTLYHIPPGHPVPSTLQLGEPAVIAAETGITTIADFRPADMALGGQGAPLVPYFDWLFFRSPEGGRALQNIGGIANVTYLPPGASLDQVTAFDTGPGNMVLDRLASLVSGGRLAYDPQGSLAARGSVQEDLLAQWLDHPYFCQAPPKSTGRELFGHAYSEQLYRACTEQNLSPEDTLATATALTARSIARSYADFLPGGLAEVIVSGGGVHNQALMQQLQALMPGVPVCSSAVCGVPPDMKEALAFAVLAYSTFFGLSNNVPAVTGASGLTVLGKIVPGRNFTQLPWIL